MTKIIKESDQNAINIANDILQNGGIICLATETLYGLACDAGNDKAVKKLYEIKNRQENKPIAVFTANLEIAKKFLNFSQIEEKFAQNFMPGMVTLLLNKKLKNQAEIHISKLLNQNNQTIGLRIPDHNFCLSLLKKFNKPIAVSSANISNQTAATQASQVKEIFMDKIDLIIDGGICANKIASTILKIADKQAKIIRLGLISQKQIDQFLCKI